MFILLLFCSFISKGQPFLTNLGSGTAGQVLTKTNSTTFNYAFADAPYLIVRNTGSTGVSPALAVDANTVGLRKFKDSTNIAWKQSDSSLAAYLTGTIPVANGGTGASSASITAFNNITGYTASGATGTTSTNIVFSTSPTLTTPNIGVATATSINKMAITAPATSSTFAVADGKSAIFSNTLTFTGTDGSSVNFGAGGAIIYDDPYILGLQALGSVIKGESLNARGAFLGSSYTMFDNTAVYVAVYLAKGATLTGVKFALAQAGVYTADQNNYVALYTTSAGTLTRVAISANNATLWTATANTMVTVPFSGTYVATAGVYYVGFLYNNSAQVTNPNLAGDTFGSITILSTQDFTNTNMLHGRIGGQNTLPTTQALSGLTASTDRIWIAIY